MKITTHHEATGGVKRVNIASESRRHQAFNRPPHDFLNINREDAPPGLALIGG